MDIRVKESVDSLDGKFHNMEINNAVETRDKQKTNLVRHQEIKIVESKCELCSQKGKCISSYVEVFVRNLTICEFCYRKILFTGIANIKPDDLGWEIVMCNTCKEKRLKSANEIRYCNCTDQQSMST